MKAKCDNCNRVAEQRLDYDTIGIDIEITYIQCSLCGVKVTSFVTDGPVRKLIAEDAEGNSKAIKERMGYLKEKHGGRYH